MTPRKQARPRLSGKVRSPRAAPGGTVPQPPRQEGRPANALPSGLLAEIRDLILDTRQRAAQAVNAALTLLYWQVGGRIRREILKEKRAEYGMQILQTLSAKLEAEFGRGFAEKNLRRMVQFAEVFPEREIVVSLIRQLTWTHFVALIPLKEPLQRDFYAELCRVERWSVRTLRSRMDSMLYERTALSKKPAHLIDKELKALREEDRLTPDLVFRDPYVLDFLGLKDTYSEKALENALLRKIESFLLELGTGFAFVERQEGEEKPLGLILCAGKKRETVEVLELEPRGIHVAEYLTELPPRELLEKRLHEAVVRARLRLDDRAERQAPAPPASSGSKKSPR